MVVTAVVLAPEVVVVIVVGVLVIGVVLNVVKVFAGEVMGVNEVTAVELVVLEKQYCFTALIICPILSIFKASAEEAKGINADCTFCQQA